MTGPGSDTNGQSTNFKPPIFTIAIVLSLSITFLDSSVRILRNVPEASLLSSRLSPFAPLLCGCVLFYLILYLIIIYPATRIFKLDATALAITSAILIVLIYVLTVLNNQIRYTFVSISDLASLSLLSEFAVLAVYTLVVTYFAVKYIADKHTQSRVLARLFLAAPFLMAEAFLALWLKNYHLGSFFSKASIIINAALAVCGILIIVTFLRISSARKVISFLYIFALVTIASSVIALASEPISQMTSRRTMSTGHPIKHVILIIIDSLRADALSCYDSEAPATPNIDHFAKDGILFKNAFSASPWTLPSVSSIMTGLSASVHMALKPRTRLPDNFKTLAEYMQGAGYLTGAIGRNSFLRKSYNISQGFVEYSFFPKPRNTSLGGKLLKALFPKRFKTGASTRDLANLTIDWLESNVNNDFFLWVHFFDPHMPYTPPAEFLPANSDAPPRIGKSFSRLKAVRGGHLVPSLQERRWIRSLYESEVRYVDTNVGRVFERLKELGIYDESLIILTSDHGEELWEHDGFEHGHNVYDEVIRVPLIIKLPASSSKQAISGAVSIESIMPTVLELCGVEYNGDYLSSRCLTGLWDRPFEAENHEPIISTSLLYYEDRVSVLSNGLKYIRWLVTGQEELYDMGSDPGEKNCIAELSSEQVQRARAILQKHFKEAEKLKRYYNTSKSEKIVLDEETRQRLKSLGYVE